MYWYAGFGALRVPANVSPCHAQWLQLALVLVLYTEAMPKIENSNLDEVVFEKKKKKKLSELDIALSEKNISERCRPRSTD